MKPRSVAGRLLKGRRGSVARVSRRMIGAVAAAVVVLGALGVGFATASVSGKTYTGCLQGGLITKVKVGSKPTDPCPDGAKRISWNQTGLDGVPGTDGVNTLIRTTPEAAGSNCPNGGQKVESGLDNGAGGGVPGDGTLQDGEVQATAYVCNGQDGSGSGPALLTGHGRPAQAFEDFGNIGDFYRDLDTDIVYGPKLTAWPENGTNCLAMPHLRVDWRYCVFTGINLNGAGLNSADLTQADLRASKLQQADLSNATLTYAALSDADLSGANMSASTVNLAFLDHATLSDTDLRGANLSGSDLTGIVTAGVMMDNADLTNADLTDVHFRGATLIGANLTGAILDGVTWFNSRCPDGSFSDLNEGSTCIGHL